MYDLTASFVNDKNKREGSYPIYLYAVTYNSGAGTLYYTSNNSDVTYFKPGTSTSQTYTAAPIGHGNISNNTKGEIESVQITLQNVDRVIIDLLLTYDGLRGEQVDIMLVFNNSLTDSDNNLRDTYYIETATVNENNAVFTLTSKFIVDKVILPSRTYTRDQCSWSFKSKECCGTTPCNSTTCSNATLVAATICNKTLSRCEELSNQSRIGNFPSIPSRAIYF